LVNLAEASGVVDPLTGAPYVEPVITGLAGGIGFMYAVFDYEGHAPMVTLVLRHHPEDWFDAALGRMAVTPHVVRTGSAKVARSRLDAELDDGRAALVTVAGAALGHVEPISGIGGPWNVNVIGRDGHDYLYEDLGPNVRRIDADALAAARSTDRKAKHRAVSIHGPCAIDGREEVVDAIRSTHRGFTGPVLGHSFDVNFGLSGLDRFASALEDTTTKRGWLRLFAADRRAPFAMLSRVHDCIELDLSAPGGLRPQYCQFLRATASAVAAKREEAMLLAAGHLEQSGLLWQRLAEEALNVDGPLRRYGELAELRREAAATGSALAEPDPADTAGALAEQAAALDVDGSLWRPHLLAMAESVREIQRIETLAMQALAEL
jgi:hypothetical protein